VLTSGHDGMFPPGLPVGVVTRVENGEVRVVPAVDLDRIEHVQLVDFGIPGGLAIETPQGLK
jgi:rod shape-determining protein MreC